MRFFLLFCFRDTTRTVRKHVAATAAAAVVTEEGYDAELNTRRCRTRRAAWHIKEGEDKAATSAHEAADQVPPEQLTNQMSTGDPWFNVFLVALWCALEYCAAHSNLITQIN
uniref:Uncharacterized protein n=1 Tax=Anopheles atroparvus TaxID=41427 RepID=A0AAG5DB29_ANOAO